MAKAKEFTRKLDKLFRVRTNWLRRSVGQSKPGNPPLWSKKKVSKALTQLEAIARTIITKTRAKQGFDEAIDHSRQWHPKKNKGWNREDKKNRFGKWFDEEIGTGNCIYAFWKKKRCLYVGKTENGKSRPQSHFSKHWFNAATRIDIYVVKSTSLIHKAECLAIDRWDPIHNKKRSAKTKYRKKCPVCSAVFEIRDELKGLFRMR